MHYILTSQIPAIFFLNMRNIRKKTTEQWQILSFLVFSFSQRWYVFGENDEFSKSNYVKNLYDLETFHLHLQKARFVVCYF